MTGIAQECGPAGPRLQGADLSLYPKILLQAAVAGHAFREMDVEVVADDVPADIAGSAREQILEEAGKVLLGTTLADRALNLPGGDVEAGDQGLGAVAAVLELLPLHLPRLERQGRRDLLERLHPGHFVDRHRTYRRIGRGGGLLIDRADLGALGLELRIGLGREPKPHAMRLQVGRFLACARSSAARSGRRARA